MSKIKPPARQSAARASKLQSKSPDSEYPDGPPTPAERVWQIVAMIPSGKVASYGQIARLAEMPRHARLVGRTLRELPAGTRLPWHRVVNAGMKISQRPGSSGHRLQRQRLEAEGIEFVGERIPGTFRWDAGLVS